MITPKDKKTFTYTHTKGCWAVFFDRERYHYAIYVMDGRDRHTIPLALSFKNVEHTLEKLHNLPNGKVSNIELFLRCVKGAALISMKYGR